MFFFCFLYSKGTSKSQSVVVTSLASIELSVHVSDTVCIAIPRNPACRDNVTCFVLCSASEFGFRMDERLLGGFFWLRKQSGSAIQWA